MWYKLSSFFSLGVKDIAYIGLRDLDPAERLVCPNSSYFNQDDSYFLLKSTSLSVLQYHLYYNSLMISVLITFCHPVYLWIATGSQRLINIW